MACVNPDGTLSESARKLLEILAEPHTVEGIAAKSGQPLFKIRSSLREMMAAGYVMQQGETWQIVLK